MSFVHIPNAIDWFITFAATGFIIFSFFPSFTLIRLHFWIKSHRELDLVCFHRRALHESIMLCRFEWLQKFTEIYCGKCLNGELKNFLVFSHSFYGRTYNQRKNLELYLSVYGKLRAHDLHNIRIFLWLWKLVTLVPLVLNGIFSFNFHILFYFPAFSHQWNIVGECATVFYDILLHARSSLISNEFVIT